ncbi:SH3 domain-containing protein [Spongiimicrobium sp. 2-473A-2-J]|uniref:SH3 domain-containing protein n=1 Tax=Eudoraea algarum TaxID=3417568 RepID=UPI003D35C4C4
MYPVFFLFILLSFSHMSYSQGRDLENLLHKKRIIESKIDDLKDSLSVLQKEIAKVKEDNFQIVLNESKDLYTCRATTRMRDKPSAFGKILKIFDQDTEVMVISFEGDYFRIQSAYGTGYVHRTYVTKGTANTSSSNKPSITNSIKSTNTSASNYKSISASKKSYSGKSTPRKYKSKTYYRGPRGGCYYINSNGNKTYVDRSMCN